MERQKKNESGITLVALVVSIIVMLVLAGVSLNATIGENGIVTRAQEAALKQRVAEELENLNLELTKMNVDTISTDETMAIQEIANYLLSKGVIDGVVKTSSNQIAAGIDTATGNKYFFGTKGDNTYRITRGNDGLLSAELTTYTSGGDITGGYALVTADSFNNDESLSAEEKGKFTITSDAEVVFMDTISGALSIYVASGVHATVGVYANIELTNEHISRSAIDIEPGGTLELYIAEDATVRVNSGFGDSGATSDSSSTHAAPGGNGAYAGIHCWNDGENQSQLFLFGKGTLIAIGGDAGDGGSTTNGSRGGGGGGGAGAGIGGNGGTGGNGNDVENSTKSGLWWANDGEKGQDCGYVEISEPLKVYAYGGAGGSGGVSHSSSGTGGGGYPAAGIGGGGAGAGAGGGTAGGGGYTGGNQEQDDLADRSEVYVCAVNGNSGRPYNCTNTRGSGGGYLQDLTSLSVQLNENRYGLYGFLGGGGGVWYSSQSTFGGDGGVAGRGGTINLNYSFRDKLGTETDLQYNTTKMNYIKSNYIFAYNGNKYTDETVTNNETTYISGHEPPITNASNACQIYAQNGRLLPVYKHLMHWNNELNTYYSNLLGETINLTQREIGCWNYSLFTCLRAETICDTTLYGQGIGSGAGYVELSNGTINLN